MRITTNKENWSGEEITVNVNQREKAFSLYGYHFKLVVKNDYSKDEYPMVIYSITSPSWDYPLGTVVHSINAPDNKFHNEHFEAFHGEIAEESLSRYGENLYDASIKMLCNTI